MTKSVYIVAVESSADHVGAGLIKSIKKKSSAIKLLGVGGPFMETEGVISRIDTTGLAIVGFVEAIKSYPKIMNSIKSTVKIAVAAKSIPSVLKSRELLAKAPMEQPSTQ